jgi:hypothetical protein
MAKQRGYFTATRHMADWGAISPGLVPKKVQSTLSISRLSRVVRV